MKATYKNIVPIALIVGAIVAIASLVFLLTYNKVFGDAVTNPASSGVYKSFTFFSTSTTQSDLGVTAFSTSTIGYATSTAINPWFNTNGERDAGYFVVAGAKHVNFVFSRGATSTNTGSSNFTVEVQPIRDGSWYPYNTLLQNLASSTERTTISSVSIAAGTSTTMAYMQDLGFYAVRCISLIVTDGANYCSATADF